MGNRIGKFRDWLAFRLWLCLPIESRVAMWLLPYAGSHAFRPDDEP